LKEMMLLVEPLIPGLRRYSRSLVHDREAADDLVQDCLERVISRWHQHRPDGDVRGWVYAILHNIAINYLKRKSRRGQEIGLDDVEEGSMTSRPAQEDGLRHQDILRMLWTLPEDQRSVVLLISGERFSYAETARILDIPTGTVMSRLARARERLMQAMEGGTVVPIPARNSRRAK
jgi:RNA polymerase sigma factor (sigma-70 family)